jgi:Family of unknown function (DUF6455)
MSSTMFNIVIFVSMIALCAGVIVWFVRSFSGDSEKRMTRMMNKVGLDSEAAPAQRRIEKDIAGVRARCRKCQTEDECERWLAGEVKGENSFCPNASVFNQLIQDTDRAA